MYSPALERLHKKAVRFAIGRGPALTEREIGWLTQLEDLPAQHNLSMIPRGWRYIDAERQEVWMAWRGYYSARSAILREIEQGYE